MWDVSRSNVAFQLMSSLKVGPCTAHAIARQRLLEIEVPVLEAVVIGKSSRAEARQHVLDAAHILEVLELRQHVLDGDVWRRRIAEEGDEEVELVLMAELQPCS